MAKKRRHRTSQGEIEDQILSRGRWSGLHQQDKLIGMNHTQQENDAAEQRCRQFLDGGINAISWSELLGER